MPARKRLAAAAYDRHIVTVRTPSSHKKIFQVQFSRSDGSLFLHFPYFSETDGFLSHARRNPRSEGHGIDYESEGARTSHRVKFSHHPDGRAHFSQTGRIRTEIKKSACRLNTISGIVFLVRIHGLSRFEPVTERDTKSRRDRILVGAEFDGEVEAVDFIGYWYPKQHLLTKTSEETLGPLVQFRGPTGATETGALACPASNMPPRERVVVLSAVASTPTADMKPFLLMVGGFDSPLSLTEPQAETSFLMLAYPREAVELVSDLFPSVDLPKS